MIDAAAQLRLLAQVDRFYARQERSKATVACVAAMVVGLLVAGFGVQFVSSLLGFVLLFGVVFLTAQSVLLCRLLPETRAIKKVRDYIQYALENPSVVELIDGGKKVRIRREDDVYDLSGLHATCWTNCVEASLPRSSKQLSGSYRALQRTERALREREQQLEKMRAQLKDDAEHLSERSNYVAQAEEDLMAKLNAFTLREAELEQMEEDLKAQSKAPFSGSDTERVEALKKREREIEALKQRLESEAAELSQQRGELQALQQELTDGKHAFDANIADFSDGFFEDSDAAEAPHDGKTPESGQDSDSEPPSGEYSARQDDLDELRARLSREAAELERRSKDIAATEDALIQRLNDLDLREVALEQKTEDFDADLKRARPVLRDPGSPDGSSG